MQSQFEVLRVLPVAPPRRSLAGLQFWRYFARHARMIGPFLLLLPLFAIVAPLIFLSTRNNATQQNDKFGRAIARVLQIERITDSVNGQGWAEQTSDLRPYFIKYSFQADGRAYTGAAFLTVNGGTFNGLSADDLKIDSELPIAYLADNPERSGLREESAPSQFPSEIFFVFPFFALALFGPALFPIFRLWWRARRLVQNGQLCNGRVVWIATLPPLGQGGSNEFDVHYEFLFDGQTHSGKMRCNNLWLVQHLPPDAPIVVACDATQPKHSVFLEPFVA